MDGDGDSFSAASTNKQYSELSTAFRRTCERYAKIVPVGTFSQIRIMLQFYILEVRIGEVHRFIKFNVNFCEANNL